MRTLMTIGAVLLLVVGVGRGDPPSAPATPTSPAPLSIPPLQPIQSDVLNWRKTERIDTPAPSPAAKPPEVGEKPDAKKLKEEMDKLLKEQTDKLKEKGESTDDRTKLHNKLADLVDKIEQQKKGLKPTPPKPTDGHESHPPAPAKPVLPEGGKPIDLVRAAGNYFKSGDVEAAYQLLRVVDTTQLPKEDRAFADYVRAACLRKKGQTVEAVKLYRTIADSKDDPFLAESAIVQISAINSSRELETQLEQLKSRRKTK